MQEQTEAPPRRRVKLGTIVSVGFQVIRGTAFAMWIVATLSVWALTATIWATYATFKAAQLTYRIGEMAYQHRRELSRGLAKARLRRLAVATPLAGAGVALYFEQQGFEEWRELYPNGTRSEYLCDMASLTTELLDEMLQELPSAIRPANRTMRNWIPECDLPAHTNSTTADR